MEYLTLVAAQPLAATSLEKRIDYTHLSSQHNSLDISERSSADYSLSNNVNNKESILKGHQKDNFLGWVALAVLVGLAIWAANCYSLPQQYNRNNQYRKNKEEETKVSSLESSLEGEEKLTEENEKTLLSAIIASSIYNSKSPIKEKTNKEDYTTKSYEELKGELGEKDIEIDEEGIKDIYGNRIIDGEKVKEDYNVEREDGDRKEEAEEQTEVPEDEAKADDYAYEEAA